jgi:hypothetical protein
VPLRTLIAGFLSLLGLAGTALAVPAAPAYAAGGADVTVTITHDPAALKAGKHVAYRITVHNVGSQPAAKVSIDFITTAALTSPDWNVSTGRCLRSPAETACLFGTLKPGGSAWATISGVLPTSLPPGTEVKNTVTLTSDTALVNPDHSTANADYTMPGGSPSPVPPSASTGAGSAIPQAQPVPARTGNGPLWIVVVASGIVAAIAFALLVSVLARRRGARPR